jgi:hypothetical protein
VSGGGSVAVLSNEDEFFCPNCDPLESSSEASYSGYKVIIISFISHDLFTGIAVFT